MTDTASHQTVRLGRGRHNSPEAGACVMELASMLAGERFTDRPKAVCPVIAAFLRCYNDGIDDPRRQDLLPIAALVVGTAGPRRIRARRAALCQGRLQSVPASYRWRCRLGWPSSVAVIANMSATRFLQQADHDGAMSFVRELATVGAPDDEAFPPALPPAPGPRAAARKASGVESRSSRRR